MKKMSVLVAVLFCGLAAFGQAVKDRNVVPVAVSLNQVLRMTVTNGGNIEFVFNTISDYKEGISALRGVAGDDMYKTDFTVSSSTRWKVAYGAEQATFVGTDNPLNTLLLDNVGFTIANNGLYQFEATGAAKATTDGRRLFSAPTNNATEVAALEAFPVDLIEDNDDIDEANAGDAADNSFTLNWRCGTVEVNPTTPMNALPLIEQTPSPAPDRYVVNVLFDLSIDN
ncbi:MAG: hypothetical protein JXR27_10750 [Paludibacteraceae bacterium]|nr:hypothetical protein [Paludibacteraceae bacterium]